MVVAAVRGGKKDGEVEQKENHQESNEPQVFNQHQGMEKNLEIIFCDGAEH